MSAGPGKLFIFKIEDPGNPGTYITVGGFRSNAMTINGETIDITDKDSGGFRELLDGGGIKSMSVSGSGVFKDSAGEEELRSKSHSGMLAPGELTASNGDKWTADFQVTSYERGGEHAAEETFSVSLESSGVVVFTPAA